MSSVDSIRLGNQPGAQLAKSTPYQLRALVLDYLFHQGYTNTAKVFARDSTVRHLDADGDELATSSKDLSHELPEDELRQVKLREKIRHQILAGCVDEATADLNEYFPSVLSGPLSPRPTPSSSDRLRISDAIPYAPMTSVDPADLTLNLRILSFIEACRTIPLPYISPHKTGDDSSSETPNVTTRPQGELTSSHEDAPHEAEAEDECNPDHEMEDSVEKQLALLSKAQKLLALANKITNPVTRDTFLKELNHVGGLLAYKVPEHSSISRYLSQERREAYADQINRAILDRMGLSSVSNLELLARYTSTVWLFAHHCGVKVRHGALIPPTLDSGSDSDTPTVHKEPETVPEFILKDFLDFKT